MELAGVEGIVEVRGGGFTAPLEASGTVKGDLLELVRTGTDSRDGSLPAVVTEATGENGLIETEVMEPE
jgi:hypothetical protein